MKLITGVVVLLFILTSCFNAGVSDTNQETAERDDSNVVTVNLEILLGQHQFDSIRYDVVLDEGDNFEGSLDVDSDDAQVSIEIEVPWGVKSTITYYCYVDDVVAAGNNETVQTVVEATIASSPDYVPVVTHNVSEYSVKIDENFQFDFEVDDISSSLKYEYDFLGDGTFTKVNQHVYRTKGSYDAVITIDDGINVVMVPVEVIVLDHERATDAESSEQSAASSADISSSSEEASTKYSIQYISPIGGDVVGAEVIVAGDEVTLSYVEKPGYQFETFVVDSGSAILDGSLLSEVQSDVLVTALFISKKYVLSFDVVGTCGTITLTNGLEYTVDAEDLTIETTLDDNCNVYYFSGDLNMIDGTINGISHDGLMTENDTLVVTVTFTEAVIEQTNISIECYLDGTKQASCNEIFGSVEPALFTLSEDDTHKQIIQVSHVGYQFIEFTAQTNVQIKGDTAIFKEGSVPGVVNAYFETKEFDITVLEGANGTITQSTITTTVGVEETVTVNASANLGYTFDGWDVINCTIASGYEMRADQVRFRCTDEGSVEARFKGLPPTSISIDNGPGTMALGASNIILSYTILPNSTPNKQVLWASSNGDIVRVANGVLEAVAGGSVDITATTVDGARTHSISVIVDSLLDTRVDVLGGKKMYKIVRINDVVWMADNLDYRKKGNCGGMGDDRCDEFGSYYRYDSVATACPAGWSVPSKSDWESFEQFVDGDNGGSDNDAGRSLKAYRAGWTGNYAGNPYTFNALPSGYSTYTGAPNMSGAHWWSSTYHSENGTFKIPNYWTASISGDALSIGYNVSGDSLPLRCIQD
ncbi:MAG: Ig-like domain-containing protein [Fibrobacterales bacterium]